MMQHCPHCEKPLLADVADPVGNQPFFARAAVLSLKNAREYIAMSILVGATAGNKKRIEELIQKAAQYLDLARVELSAID